jgi:hypothetical protein
VGFVGLMEIGVLCAVMRHWSGSLWAAILAHAVNNAFAGGAFVLGMQDPTIPPPVWTLVAGAALLALYVVLGVRVLSRPPAMATREEPLPRYGAATFVVVGVWAVSLVAGGFAWFSGAVPRG